MLEILFVTLVFFALAMSIMGIGYIIGGRPLRGSCGGVMLKRDGRESCSVCGRGSDEDCGAPDEDQAGGARGE